MATVNVYEAKRHLSALLERASAGERIIIARAGKPVAMLGPIAPASKLGIFASDFEPLLPPSRSGASSLVVPSVLDEQATAPANQALWKASTGSSASVPKHGV